MKKIITILLCVIMVFSLAALLFACAADEDPNNGGNQPVDPTPDPLPPLNSSTVFKNALEEIMKANVSIELNVERRYDKEAWYPVLLQYYKFNPQARDLVTLDYGKNPTSFWYDVRYTRSDYTYSSYYSDRIGIDQISDEYMFERYTTENMSEDNVFDVVDGYVQFFLLIFSEFALSEENFFPQDNGGYKIYKEVDVDALAREAANLQGITANDWFNNMFRVLGLNITIGDVVNWLKIILGDASTIGDVFDNIDLWMKTLSSGLSMDDLLMFAARLIGDSTTPTEMYEALVMIFPNYEKQLQPLRTDNTLESRFSYLKRVATTIRNEPLLDTLNMVLGENYIYSIENYIELLNIWLTELEPLKFLGNIGAIGDRMTQAELELFLWYMDSYVKESTFTITFMIDADGRATDVDAYFLFNFEAEGFDETKYREDWGGGQLGDIRGWAKEIANMARHPYAEFRANIKLRDYGTTSCASRAKLDNLNIINMH